MGQALYRKYRSRTLNEIIGQDHITKTLENSIKSGNVSHAYLFTGPRGVGKTSIARILAREVNGLSYEDSLSHLDIIEIDAASNRRIDEIRELRDRINLAPTSAKYKVYIIDEVHMLTREAFNALLKTLEEPPAHVIFILATTESNKVPETISSRTQQFKFRPIPPSQMIEHLKFISKSEKIKIDESSLRLIAEAGEGSFRDSISLLDQVSKSDGVVDQAELQLVLGLAPEEVLKDILQALEHNSAQGVVDQVTKIFDEGYSASSLSKQLFKYLERLLISGDSKLPSSQILHLMNGLIDVQSSDEPESALEMCLLDSAIKNKAQTKDSTEPAAIVVEQPVVEIITEVSPSEIITEEPITIEEAKQSTDENLAFSNEVWESVLEEIKSSYFTLYSVIRMAAVEPEQNKLVLKTKFPFHQRKLNEDKSKILINQIVKSKTGQDMIIESILDKNMESKTASKIASVQPDDGHLTTISNIFGNLEMIE
jgi:DNA polymerase-3 subunit gamma/tau